MRRPEALAAAALALVLIVVAASAAIRLGAQEPVLGALRLAHRTAASLEVLVLAGLAWLAWRTRQAGAATAAAIALTVMLSAIGIVAGQRPSPAASMANIVGGLALAACFAWMLAPARAWPRRAGLFAALLLAQGVLGAALSIHWRDAPLMLLAAHVLLGAALVLGAAWLALRARWGGMIAVLSAAVAATGGAALMLDRAFAPALLHAAAVAALVVVLVASLDKHQGARASRLRW
ncbi:MAG TPA: hypothetical protein VFK84_07230 [Burkholderiales bacterium]|nr:hypothetical protein [Burkholderiales bacterium]